MEFVPDIQGGFNSCKLINVIYHLDMLKNSNQVNMSIDAERGVDEMQHSFMIKQINKVGYGRNSPLHNQGNT